MRQSWIIAAALSVSMLATAQQPLSVEAPLSFAHIEKRDPGIAATS